MTMDPRDADSQMLLTDLLETEIRGLLSEHQETWMESRLEMLDGLEAEAHISY
jgi:hypothetical protein